MKVRVTQQHIDLAIKTLYNDNPDIDWGLYCPIAQALRDMHFSFVSVQQDFVQRTNYDVYLPAPAIAFTEDFDENVPVTPFEFDLDLNNKVPANSTT